MNFLLAGMTILFMYLKLTAQIAWSWWIVLAPVWVPFALMGAISALAIGVAWITTTRR